MKAILSDSKSNYFKRTIKKIFGAVVYSKFISIQSTIRHPGYRLRMLEYLNHMAKLHPKVGELSAKQMQQWKRNFCRLIFSLYEEKRVKQLIAAFYEMNIRFIKPIKWSKEDEPIVICVIYNDLNRIKSIIDYYRKQLFVKQFVFIDNGSTDGTREFLQQQEDVALLYTEDKFDSRKKAMWINYTMSIIGDNKWYLVIDSDECFCYPHFEKMNLKEFTKKMENEKREIIKAYMLELYPNTPVFNCDSDDDFMSYYCYCDADSEYYLFDELEQSLKGGMHARVFGQEYALLSKIPLFKKNKYRFLIGPHNIMPISEDISDDYWNAILLHYKFLPSDKGKIDEIVEKKTYAHGSLLYKDYQRVLQNKDNQLLTWDGSIKWKGTETFSQLPLFREQDVKV